MRAACASLVLLLYINGLYNSRTNQDHILSQHTFVLHRGCRLPIGPASTAVVLTSYLMLGLQFAASDLEDPFGYDLSDLELDLVSHLCQPFR